MISQGPAVFHGQCMHHENYETTGMGMIQHSGFNGWTVGFCVAGWCVFATVRWWGTSSIGYFMCFVDWHLVFY